MGNLQRCQAPCWLKHREGRHSRSSREDLVGLPEVLSLASSSSTERSVEKERRRPAPSAILVSLVAASCTKAASHASAASLCTGQKEAE